MKLSLGGLEIVEHLLFDDVLSIHSVSHSNFYGKRLLPFLRINDVEVLSHLLSGPGCNLRRWDALQIHAHVLLDCNLQSDSRKGRHLVVREVSLDVVLTRSAASNDWAIDGQVCICKDWSCLGGRGSWHHWGTTTENISHRLLLRLSLRHRRCTTSEDVCHRVDRCWRLSHWLRLHGTWTENITEGVYSLSCWLHRDWLRDWATAKYICEGVKTTTTGNWLYHSRRLSPADWSSKHIVQVECWSWSCLNSLLGHSCVHLSVHNRFLFIFFLFLANSTASKILH